MAFFVSHASESKLEIDEVLEQLSSMDGVSAFEVGELTPQLIAKCEYRSSFGELADIRVFANLISLEGFCDSILEFVVQFKAKYGSRLAFGNTEAPSDISLDSVNSVEELRSAMESNWG